MKNLLFFILALCPMVLFGQNLLTNGGFETGDLSGWTKKESVAIESAAANVRTGTYSVRQTATRTRDLGQTIGGIVPGNEYKITVWCKVDFGDGTDARIWSYWRNASGNITIADNNLRPSTFFSSNSWSKYEVTATAPTGATSLYFEVRTYRGATVYWDDLSVERVVSGPTIGVNSAALTGLNYKLSTGGPSAEQTVTVAGTNLTADINVTAPTNFEVSLTSGSGFASSVIMPQAGGTLYVRLRSGLAEGDYNGNINLASGSTTEMIQVSGSVSNPTTFAPGDLVFIGFDTYLDFPNPGNDEMSLLTMVDIKPGTKFIIGNGAYESGAAANTRTDKWYNNSRKAYFPGLSEITYNGSANIAAGSVICFKTQNAAGSPFDFRINNTPSTDFSSAHPIAGQTEGYVNVNSSAGSYECIFLMQGTLVNGRDGVGKYVQLTDGTVLGQVLFRDQYVGFGAAVGAVDSPDNMQSRKHPHVECFAINIPNNVGFSSLNYDNAVTTGTKAQLMSAIADVATNWTIITGNTNSSAGATTGVTNCNQSYTINASAGNAWVGGATGDMDNWFNCNNWSEKAVPNENTDVVITNTTQNCQVDVAATFSDNFGDVAECKNLTIPTSSKLQVQTTNSVLKVFGNLTIESGADLDMDKGGTQGGKIEIKGNLTNNEAADTEDNDKKGLDAGNHSEVEFNGTAKQFYTGVAGNEIEFSTLTINNAAGLEMTTGGNSNMEVGEALNLTAGKVILNDNVFDIKESCLGSITVSNKAAYLQTNSTGTVEVSKVGATEVQIPVGNSTTNWIHLKNNNVTKQNYNVRVADNINTSYNTSTETETGTDVTKEAIDRVWWISSASTDTEMTLYWDATGGYTLPNFDPASVLVSHYTGGAWDTGGASSAVADAHGGMKGVKRVGISSFSPFGVASSANALPVELLSFTGRKANKSVVLNWATATEINNDRFEVEFSTNGKDFKQIGKVAGNGNTTEEITYDFTHDAPVAGVNYYRLKQIDFDGTYEYSKVIEVKFNAASNNVYVRPTVATDKVELVVETSFNKAAKVQVVDVTGKIVMTSTLVAGKTNLNLNITDLAKGHYFVKVAGMNQTFTTRFIKK